MPKLSMNKKNNKNKQSKPRGKPRGGKASSGNSQVLSLARLLADPCEAPLIAPQYGASDAGYLSKFSKFVNLNMGSVGTSGYCVWFPDYSGLENQSGGNGSLYFYGTADSSVGPVNTLAAPLGRAAVYSAVNGSFQSDPSRSFVGGDTVQDARTISACLKFVYTGRSDSLAGRVGVIEHFPREALLTGGASGTPPNVNELFTYCTRSTRTPLDAMEVKHRPGDGAESYRASGGLQDSCIIQGASDSTQISYLPTTAPSGSTPGIGFVWDGLSADSSLSFDLLKAIEWRPEMHSGLTAPKATVAPGGGNMVSKSIAWLDKSYPGWQTQAFKAAKSLGASVANLAVEGARNEVIRDVAPLLLTMF